MKRIIVSLLLVLATALSAPTAPLTEDNYDKGWKSLESYVKKLNSSNTLKSLGEMGFNGISIDAGGTAVRASFGNILNTMKIMEAAAAGDFRAVQFETGNTLIGKFAPLFAQYMVLFSVSKVSYESVIENWMLDLFSTRAYADFLTTFNDMVVESAKARDPYIPSFVVERYKSYIHHENLDTAAVVKQKMIEKEDRMFSVWMSKSPDIELGQNGNPARLRQWFGHDPKDMREIFNRFLTIAYGDQQDFVVLTFERASKQAMEDAKKRLYEETRAKLKRRTDRLAEPRVTELYVDNDSYLRYGYAGMPGYDYTVSIYLGQSYLPRDHDDKYVEVRTETKTAYDTTMKGRHTPTLSRAAAKNQDAALIIVEDEFGRSDSKTLTFRDVFTTQMYHQNPPITHNNTILQTYAVAPHTPPYTVETSASHGTVTVVKTGEKYITLHHTTDTVGPHTVSATITDGTGRVTRNSYTFDVAANEFREKKLAAQKKAAEKRSSPAKPLPPLPITPSKPVAPQPGPVAPQPQPQPVPQVSGNQPNYVDIGQRRVHDIAARIKNRFMPSCAPGYAGFERNVLRNTNRGSIIEVGKYNQRQLADFESMMSRRIGSQIAGKLKTLKPNDCTTKWAAMMNREGYLSDADHARFKTGGPSADYYSLITLSTHLTDPDSCKVVSGKPSTGVSGKHFLQMNQNDPNRGWWVYKTWTVAAGPGTRQQAQKYCNRLMNRQTNISAHTTPWRPTGGGGRYQMPEREYIMPMPR